MEAIVASAEMRLVATLRCAVPSAGERGRGDQIAWTALPVLLAAVLGWLLADVASRLRSSISGTHATQPKRD